MRLTHGFVGTLEVEKALEEFNRAYIYDADGSYYNKDKKILIKTGHNNRVQGEEFVEVEELLEGKEANLDTYKSLEDYKEQMSEWDDEYDFDEDGSDVIDELESGETVYVVSKAGNEYISTCKETAIHDALVDGTMTAYTMDEVKEVLTKDSLALSKEEESLVIWLLS